MLRDFYKKILIFAGILLLLLVLLEALSLFGPTRLVISYITNSESYLTTDNGSDEIEEYINKATTEDASHILVLGDSVCRQLFNGLQDKNDDCSMIGSNAAITVAGQYIIAKNYLENHDDVHAVYLFMIPESLMRSFGVESSFLHTVIPFSNTGNLECLEPETIEIMEQVFGKFFVSKEGIYLIDNSGLNRKLYCNLLPKLSEDYAMKNPLELANVYIPKIKELCDEKNVEFYLISGPVSEDKSYITEELKPYFDKSELREINPDYLENIVYFPSDQAEDGTHFSGEYANREYFDIMIKNLLDKADCDLQMVF